MKKICLITNLLLISLFATAQYNINRNKVWKFGYFSGVDFTSGAPLASPSNLYTGEGTTSVSDPAGNLLFYSDGKKVWNSTGTVMPSASSIVTYTTTSTSQAAAVVPVYGNPNQYYLFSLENGESTDSDKCKLSYSIVDMTLDGGNGDVIAPSMGTLLASHMSEKMIVVPGDCSMWLLTHRADSATFLAFEITPAGINPTPVITTIGTLPQYKFGVMKISPDRQKLIVMAHNYSGIPGAPGGMELYDFSPSTGTVSNCRLIHTYNGAYGAEFSPDNSKLYTMHYGLWKIFQYDLTTPTAAAILASEYVVTDSVNNTLDLKLGPDGKIYSRSVSTYSYLSHINNPNLPGAGCNLVDTVVSIGGTLYAGLPSLYWEAPSAIISPTGSYVVCVGTSLSLYTGIAGGVWTSSAPSVATVSSTGVVVGLAAGITAISYTSSCGTTTVMITVGPPPGTIGVPGPVCTGQTIVLTNSSPGGKWTSGDIAKATIAPLSGVVTGISSGTVLITYAVGTCSITATVSILPIPNIYGSTSLCAGSSGFLSVFSTGGTWASSNTSVASIDFSTGYISAIAVGTTIISYLGTNGCMDTTSFTIVPCLSVNNFNNDESITTFPNPASGTLALALPTNMNYRTANIVLFDIVGKAAMKETVEVPQNGHVTLDVSGLPEGTYILKTDHNDKIYRSKIIIRR